MREIDKRLVQIVPSQRQLEYQQLEFYGFVHFTVNTFTGDGITDSVIDLSWKDKQVIRHIVMKENIKCSQRIETYIIEAHQYGERPFVHTLWDT